MFGYIRKRYRKKKIDDIDSIILGLDEGDKVIKTFVGHGINLSNSFFCKTFKIVSEFSNSHYKIRNEYLKKFTMTRKAMVEKDQYTGLGFALFEEYLIALDIEDEYLAEYTSKQFKPLSSLAKDIC